MVKSEIIKKTLSNGLTIVFLKNREKRVLVHVGVGAGHLMETFDNQGISHFVEHVLWEGSKNYPNYFSLKDKVEKINATYNAHTSTRETVFFMWATRKYFNTVIDILLDIVQNPLFDSNAIEKQRKIIFNELSQAEDQVHYQSMKLMLDSLLPEDRPKFNPMGSKETLSKLSKKDLVDCYSTYYVPNNMVVVVSGDIDEPFDLIEKKIVLSQKNIPEFIEPKMKTITGEIFSRAIKNTDTSYINHVYPTVPSKHPDSEPLEVISQILCEGRLCLQDVIRQENGLTYNCFAASMGSEKDGLFNINLSSGKENFAEIKDLIKNHLKKLDKVTQKDVNKAKMSILKEFREELQDPQDLSNCIIENELGNEWDEFYTRKEKVSRVTKADVQRVAKKYFGDNYLISLIEQPN
jgi:zinc protease